MSFKRYPAYKDSGVEWLGEVPEHWEVVPLKQVVSRIESGTSVNSTDTPAGTEELGVLKTSCVYRGFFEAEENKAVVPEEYDRVACPVTAGTLIVSRMNTPELVGAAGVVRTSYNNLFLPDRLWQVHFSGALPDFVHHWTHTPNYRSQVEMACAGTSSSMQNLGQDEFRRFVITLPPVPEQTAIATFLDHETAKIDALVAEQEKLITLLQEKRQAVISHAVAKGLNPNAPMKDSGIEWLGEVPAHWDVRALKNIVSTPITDGPHETPQFLDEGVPFVSAEAVSQGFINFEKIRGHISAEDHQRYSQKYLPRRGDVYMVKSGATTGVTAIVETDQEFNIWSPLAALRCGDKMLPKFLLHYMRSRHFQEAVTLNWSFGTQQNIGMGVIGNLSAPVPPLEEQTVIAFLLDQETAKLDTLTAEARTAITLLQERRTALISAAVTGQIDVRNWSPQEGA